MNLLPWRVQPSSVYVRQLKASRVLQLMAEAIYLAYLAQYPPTDDPDLDHVTPFDELDVETRRAYVAFAQDSLEQLRLEQERH